MSKVIIVPVDGSNVSMNALKFAITMARAYGDQIRLVNIQPNLQLLGEPIIHEASSILDDARILYSSTIRIGTPAIEIITEAKSSNIRCIVMGTKGAGNSQNKIGSVSLALLSMAICPVVFIPAAV